MSDTEVRDKLEREIVECQKAIVRLDEDDAQEIADIAERLRNLEAQVEEFHC
jgi:hypothetical protein